MKYPVGVLIHSNSLTERGDGTTVIEIVKLLAPTGKFKFFLGLPADAKNVCHNNLRELKKLKCEIFFYDDRQQLENYVLDNEIATVYVFGAGKRSDLAYYDNTNRESYRLGSTMHISHVVFRNLDIHGDYYLYVSEWLYKWAKPRWWLKTLVERIAYRRVEKTFVGSLTHFSSIEDEKRERLGALERIPDKSKLIVRVGGFDQFNDRAAKKGVLRLLETYPDLYVILANTEVYAEHPRLFFTGSVSRGQVAELYDRCTLAINGRFMGESFGYSIVEPMILGKPVIAPHWIRNPLMDKSHISLLKGHRLTYWSSLDLVNKASKILDGLQIPQGFESNMIKYRASENVTKLEKVLLGEI